MAEELGVPGQPTDSGGLVGTPAVATPAEVAPLPDGPSPDGFTLPDPWTNILPQEYRDKGYVKGRDFRAWLQHVDNLEQIRGRSIVMPDSPDDPDYQVKLEAIYNRLGRPESPDKYAFEVPPEAPINTQALDAFRTSAHKAGLNQRQADAIVKDQVESLRRQQQSVEQQKAQMHQAMKERWGQDLYDMKMNTARAFARRMGPEVEQSLWDNGFFCLDAVVEGFYDMGRYLNAEGLMPEGHGSSRSYDDVDKEVKELKASRAYNNTGAPNHDDIRRKVKQLEDLRFALSRR